eukprot:6324648-Ditylum_brightwellii.AAC.1
MKEIPGSDLQRNGSEVKDCVLTAPSFYTQLGSDGASFVLFDNDIEHDVWHCAIDVAQLLLIHSVEKDDVAVAGGDKTFVRF